MKKKVTLFRRAGVIAACCLLPLLGVGALAVENLSAPNEMLRADVIPIDTMEMFGKLERPVVLFPHDQHTAALEKKGKDCLACHPAGDKWMSLKFQRQKDSDPTAVMDAYHDNCISCHMDTAAEGQKSGPVVCGQCHSKTVTPASLRQPMGFDKSLHYRHSKSLGSEKSCERCHHVFDNVQQKLVYKEDKIGTCRYCHKQKKEENRDTMRVSSHQACVTCHRQAIKEKKEAGPVKCAGCHDPQEQQLIEKVASVPRMKVNQPDATIVKVVAKEKDRKGRMDPVPFNHKGHESYNDTCRVCHHADLTACAACHTLEGKKKGGGVKLEQAMHQLKNDQSCLGCHAVKQENKSCAGCHDFIARKQAQDQNQCAVCHMPTSVTVDETMSKEDREGLAVTLLESRAPVRAIYPASDIPEEVVMKTLTNRFEPAKFPHRKIVNKLFENIRENNMAGTFHVNMGTLCQGCHHNSPPSKKPPACASCHGKPFSKKDLYKPGLSGAYHRQCMGCHEAMGIVKPDSRDCVACHAEKE